MKIIVQDINIIIDLFSLGLLLYCKKYGIVFHTTRYVVAEIKEYYEKNVLVCLVMNKFLMLDGFTGNDYALLQEFINECSSKYCLSEADSSVLFLSKRLHCGILTENHKIKNIAEQYGIEANGLLWVVDMMVENKIVAPNKMAIYLEKYLNDSDEAPRKDISERIEKYKDII